MWIQPLRFLFCIQTEGRADLLAIGGGVGWGSVGLSGEIKATLNFGEFSSLWLWLLSPGNGHRSEKARMREAELQEVDRTFPGQGGLGGGEKLPLYS